MRCPHCLHDIPELWQPLHITTDWNGAALESPQRDLTDGEKVDDDWVYFRAEWMMCPNSSCVKVLIRIESFQEYQTGINGSQTRKKILDRWFAVPKRSTTRPVSPLVPSKYAKFYKQASLVLSDSPTASAVLSRRVLADLLADYGEYKAFGLDDRVEAFVKDTQNPKRLRENLHYLREIGNFGGHTVTDVANGKVLEVKESEATWTLDIIDRLFDLYIVEEKKNADIRAAMDKKISRSNRKPINPALKAKAAATREARRQAKPSSPAKQSTKENNAP